MKTVKDKIVVKVEIKEKTASGIIISDSVNEKIQKGKVISIGNEVKEIVINDIVVFNKYSGVEIEIDDQKYTILKDSDVFVVLS